MMPMKVVIAYEGGPCPHCNIPTKNTEIFHKDEDRASLYRARQKLKRSAMTIALTCQRIYYERGIRVPKPYVRDMIHWAAGVNFYRPLKAPKAKYGCGCLAHLNCTNGYECPKHNTYFTGYTTSIGATLRYSPDLDVSRSHDVSRDLDVSRSTPWRYEESSSDE